MFNKNKRLVEELEGLEDLKERLIRLEVQQEQDLRNFEAYDRDLAKFQKIIEEFEGILKPFQTICTLINQTPGGLKTWLIAVTLAATIGLVAVDVSIRAIGVKPFIKFLIEETKTFK
ncbi:hypothetical protein [Microcoleus sp. bin38.metabat.b11b12b14.051]|uniref:hypothetical protein n=1 Tax=Microcoleus sp. bin38.metabat.b11b12b14.051 TaxID=2742709 RepID=UPI0025FFD298|nr:hypothetical protein [Microcoleus sp. bin38.metabat.b11b12b14.051]